VPASLACRRQRFRLVRHGLALFAGLLKYYPMALMALATRERRRVFVAVAVATAGVVATFVKERTFQAPLVAGEL
jgi:hypothetical protein